MAYRSVESSPNFPKIEKEVLRRWKKEETFEKSLKGDKDFVFYDGPPFANGFASSRPPHYRIY